MDLSKLAAGDQHYKAFVGPPLKYDLLGALQFNLLTAAGLRAEHALCDIGCGSLRAGKMLIPYLNPGNYYGLEPNEWLIKEAIKEEIGEDLIRIKSPHFLHNEVFNLSLFKRGFDFCIAQSIFSHSSLSQVENCLGQVAQALQTDGLFLATFIWGKKDYTGEDWVYPGCVEFKASTVRKLAWNKFGLKMQLTNWPHPNGQNWVVFYFPGNEDRAESIANFSMDVFKSDVNTTANSTSISSKIISKFQAVLKK